MSRWGRKLGAKNEDGGDERRYCVAMRLSGAPFPPFRISRVLAMMEMAFPPLAKKMSGEGTYFVKFIMILTWGNEETIPSSRTIWAVSIYIYFGAFKFFFAL